MTFMMSGWKNANREMIQKTRIRIVKRALKITIALGVLTVLVFLGFFVKYNHTFENSNMTKWLDLSEKQRVATLQRVVPEYENQELLMQCVTKIAHLPDSDKMDIRDAISLCYNGIKTNSGGDEK